MPQFHDTLQYDIWRRRGDSNSQTPFQGSNGFQDRAVRQYCSDANVLLSSESWIRTNSGLRRRINSALKYHSSHLGIKVLVPKIVRVEDYLCLGRRQILYFLMNRPLTFAASVSSRYILASSTSKNCLSANSVGSINPA